MDALLRASVAVLIKTGGAMLVVMVALVISFYWEGVHVGRDGIYLV